MVSSVVHAFFATELSKLERETQKSVCALALTSRPLRSTSLRPDHAQNQVVATVTTLKCSMCLRRPNGAGNFIQQN